MTRERLWSPETLEGARTVNSNDSQTVTPMQIGKGVRLAATLRLHTQGAPNIPAGRSTSPVRLTKIGANAVVSRFPTL
jgi:hypothetical protein